MLLLDAGNSRIKWARVQDGQWIASGAFMTADALSWQQELARFPLPSRIVLSNVAGEAVAAPILDMCNVWQRPLQIVSAAKTQCGVRNGYAVPQQLGSDRWASLIAAWHMTYSACLVVNCGTATTLDALSAQGEFIGGLIVPGLELMRHSLAGNTAQLGLAQGEVTDFPLNTADAMWNGALRATAGAILSQYDLLASREGDVRCVLSGGAAASVMPYLSIPVERVENLVLHGLQIIAEGKEV